MSYDGRGYLWPTSPFLYMLLCWSNGKQKILLFEKIFIEGFS